MKQSRNELCACGSGLKYKRCCGAVGGKTDLLDRARAAIQLSLDDDLKSRQLAVEQLREIRGNGGLDGDALGSVERSLLQALQAIGDYQGALDILEAFPEAENEHDAATRAYWRALSLERLGAHSEAVIAFEEAMPLLRGAMPDRYHYYLIDQGRAYVAAGRGEDAVKVWEESADVFARLGNDKEHLTRARSNIGMYLLKSEDRSTYEKGEKLLYETSNDKSMLGDFEGLSNNYSALSLHYVRVKRWERALAFGRRDLRLTRLIGNEHQLCATLQNMSVIYIEMLQLTSARRCLEEARAIAERLRHPHALRMLAANMAAVERRGRLAGQAGLKLGANAACVCASGATYEACCGVADFEPVAVLPGFNETQESVDISHESLVPFDDIRRLDRVLDMDASERFGWTSVLGRDGWIEIGELPDVASYHLSAASNLARNAHSDSGFDEPLAACILSVCAAEAFINTVCFFICDTAKHIRPHSDSLLGRAAALVGDALPYQRSTELTEKWAVLGKLLSGEGWIAPKAWREFVTLVGIRNELVHFKAAEFEQVSPTPKHPHEILRRLPAKVELRDVPHSWPARLLTASFARWSVETVEHVIEALKHGYAANGKASGSG